MHFKDHGFLSFGNTARLKEKIPITQKIPKATGKHTVQEIH